MKISVTFRNGEGENWQKIYAEERIVKLKRYLDMPAEAHIILSTEKFRCFAEINLSANGLNFNAKEEAKDMHLAIDSCIEKIEKQLKKQKEKVREHKPRSIRHNLEKIGQNEEDDEPATSKVVETRKVVLKPMSLDEAVMEIEGGKTRFIIYRDSSSENISLVYRRDDGNYALIETNS
ncbi:MAG: ribosomal subunit interface protein [Deltaproteobacteria bacterium HGW-Deltaproteobacteria-12]|jgi:putative sigma-54 modulation protein|nr:MAG: ribosomal subunit interface protein [Deltaproteobacteria bacterium HGW-Deltaproteobacteria-12]